MQFTERHSALVEHCLPTVTGGGISIVASTPMN